MKLTLWVVNLPYGPDNHQVLVPQSMTPLGYWPFSARLGLLKSSKVMVRAGGTGVGVAGTGAGAGLDPVDGNVRLSKLVDQPLVLPKVMLEHGDDQPVEIVDT